MAKRGLLISVGCGALFFGLVIATVYAQGATFGQRCEAKGFLAKSPTWQACVSALARPL